LLSESQKFKKLFDKIVEAENADANMTTESGKFKQLFDKMGDSDIENDKENSLGASNIFPVESIKKGVKEFSKAISSAADAFQHTTYKAGEPSPSRDDAVPSEDPSAWETACEIASFSWDVTKDAIVNAEENFEKSVGPRMRSLSNTIVEDVHYLSDAAKQAAFAVAHSLDNEDADGTFLDAKSHGNNAPDFIDFSDMAGLGIEVPVGMCTGMRDQGDGRGAYLAPKDYDVSPSLSSTSVSGTAYTAGMHPVSQAHGGNVDDANLFGMSPAKRSPAAPEPHIDMCTPTKAAAALKSALPESQKEKEDMKDTFDDEEGGEEWEKAEKYHHHRHGYQK
jgi:hypothetical protein